MAGVVAIDIGGTTITSTMAKTPSALAKMLGPPTIVMGGGLSRVWDLLLQPLREELAASLSYQRIPEVRAAHDGDDAGCLGAAIAALRQGGLS